MLGLLPLLYIFLACLTRVYAIFEATDSIENQTADQVSATFPWFQTPTIGNSSAAVAQIPMSSNTSTASNLTVRWDDDKIRGINVTLFDGTTVSAGGFGGYDASFEFAEDETLLTLILTSSGFGRGSFRQMNFTTSLGRNFTAGHNGYDNITQPPIPGSKIVGFNAWINPDNFLSAFALRYAFDNSSLST